MIRTISKRVCYDFCVKNKTQNFFELNPVYPDMGDKDFDLYNSERKKINVLDEFNKLEQRRKDMRDMVRKKIYLKKYDRFKTFSGGAMNKFDPETQLPLGVDSDFDAFIAKYKRDKLVGDKERNELKDLILSLVHRFKCKSEPQLIRLFRISLANIRKKDLANKMRGSIMEEALMKTASLMRGNYNQSGQNGERSEDLEDEEFYAALKQIDEKIERVEAALRFDERGLPKKLSDYDPDYGWRESQKIQLNPNYDLTTGLGNIEKVTYSSRIPNERQAQDWSIRTRINRLYFLRRLELVKEYKNDKISIDQELPLNLKQRENIMNDLANRYKEEELLQEPDIDDIYRQIDIFLDKVHVKMSPGHRKFADQTSEQVFDENMPSENFLWQNLDVEEIVCATMYNQDTLKEISLTDDVVSSVTYSPHTEITLNRLPVNLYRHSELENLGIFNDYRAKLGRDILRVEEHDFEPQFNEFSLVEANQKLEKIKRGIQKVDQTAYGHAKRKTSESEVFLKVGTGKVTINGKLIQDYFGDTMYRVETIKPFVFTDTSGMYDAQFNVAGGGMAGQSQCMAFSLARALMKVNPQHRTILSKFGLVGYDFRQKEAKKTNLYSARVRPPYVRR